METSEAIKTLIKARNEKYNNVRSLEVVEKDTNTLYRKGEVLINRKGEALIIKGHNASALFAQMRPFLEPMICSVWIIDQSTVEITMNK
jgi:hypothetical protein